MGVFQVFKIVQMVTNRAKYDKSVFQSLETFHATTKSHITLL